MLRRLAVCPPCTCDASPGGRGTLRANALLLVLGSGSPVPVVAPFLSLPLLALRLSLRLFLGRSFSDQQTLVISLSINACPCWGCVFRLTDLRSFHSVPPSSPCDPRSTVTRALPYSFFFVHHPCPNPLLFVHSLQPFVDCSLSRSWHLSFLSLDDLRARAFQGVGSFVWISTLDFSASTIFRMAD